MTKKRSKTEFFFIARCAICGRYVSLEYAKKHPKTTIVEKVKIVRVA